MTTNSLAFLVKSPIPIIDTNEDIFKTYTNWFPIAGKIFLIAWGSITNLSFLKKFSPRELPASHWDFLIELIPALKISAWNALSLIDKAIIPDTKEVNTFNLEAEAAKEGEYVAVRQVVSNKKNYKGFSKN